MPTVHQLHNSWKLWFHFNKDTSWDISSYQELFEFNNLESFCQLMKHNIDLSQGIFFLMRDNILPIWEDPRNKGGMIWSFRISLDNIDRVWADLCIRLVGETLTKTVCVNGISVHCKQQCYLVKLWTNKACRKLSFLKPAIPHVNIQGARAKHPVDRNKHKSSSRRYY